MHWHIQIEHTITGDNFLLLRDLDGTLRDQNHLCSTVSFTDTLVMQDVFNALLKFIKYYLLKMFL